MAPGEPRRHLTPAAPGEPRPRLAPAGPGEPRRRLTPVGPGAPAAPDDAGGPGAGAPSHRAGQARPPAAQPSLAATLVTTLRLWVRRRLPPLARRLWPARASGRVIALLVVAVLLLAAGAATIVLSRGKPVERRWHGAGSPGRAALLSAAAARQQAAAWVAAQVSGNAIVACDPAMCAALQAHGVAAGRLAELRPGQAAPLGSDILLATAAVRSLLGTRLGSVYAPVTLATFGAGTAQVAVRVIAPDGAAAYLAAFADDLRQRRQVGAELARNPGIHPSAAARADLLAGKVDSRLLAVLAALAGQHPVGIIRFGGPPGRGASPGVALRSADITPAGVPGGAGALRALRDFLLSQRPPYRPSAVTTLRMAPRRTALRVEFTAPSPLGLLDRGT